ncbi:MAG: hypothetical protein ABR879_05185 [Methanomassiliicoccales archaeon]
MAEAKNQTSEETNLTKGSKYKVISRGSGPEPIVTVGTFKGYTQFGNDSALAIELDPEKPDEKSMLRIVPIMSVLAIDVLSFKPEEKDKKKGPNEQDKYIG